MFKRKEIFISYLIGIPLGVIVLFIALLILNILIGESLLYILIYSAYGNSIIGLIIAFLLVLGIAGHFASKNIQKQKTRLETSFRYSLFVNSIIWSVFLIISLINIKNYLFPISISILAFLFCTLITTFTIGLLICYVIERNISN